VGRFQLFAAPRAMRIWLDPDKLVGLNLSVNDVVAAVRSQNFLIPAGTLGAPPNPDTQRVATPLRVTGQFTSVQDFENTIIRAQSDGGLVRIKDVAMVDLGLSNYVFQARLNGKPTVAFGIVLAPGANALATEARVLAELDALSAEFPTQMTYAIPYNSAPFIQASIDQVLQTLFEAMLLVFAVMFVFLQSARYTLIPALGVPVAMLGAFSIMYAMGMSINVLTMFAMVLAIGNLVDDSIVVVENVARIMAEEGRSARDATLKAMPQVFGAIVGITIILIVVFLPLAFMPGSVGVIYKQFAVAMAVSILFSGILTLTFTPALCATLLKPVDQQKQRNRRGPLGWFNRGFHHTTVFYSSTVHRMIRQPVRYLLVFLILTILMGWLYARLPGAFLPQEDQGTLFASIQLPTDASATRTAEVIDQVDQYFQQDPNTTCWRAWKNCTSAICTSRKLSTPRKNRA
jgi:multidrug efflux pump